MEIIAVVGILILGLFGHPWLSKAICQGDAFYRLFWVNTKAGRKMTLELRSFFIEKAAQNSLPQFKFFTPFILELRTLQIRHGLNPHLLLKSLRPLISEDLRFEEKVQSLFLNSVGQFFILSGFTWIFYFTSVQTLGAGTSVLAVWLLQLGGLVSFIFFYQRMRLSSFGKIDELFRRLFLFQSLKLVGLSMGEVLGKSKADQFIDLPKGPMRTLGQQLISLCEKWTKEGISIDSELRELLSELNHLRGESCRKFELRLGGLRFIHLLGFYLLAYLLVILGLIRQLASSY
ncbi:MAG: hypothetical protein ACJAT2_003301 [Bacteriovoracaceae bacterium]|jgi:hypothetical protein